MNSHRPDPDKLLEQIQREESHGKLKLFFGACAGVGKTFAMLSAAQAQQKQGRHVLIGVVETHGRAETLAQLGDLPQLPLKEIEYRNRKIREFDLDAALALKPDLILIDELAHSNVEGARHRKRWQDVQELLQAGIDVYSTVNVQHLESLNDVVGQITGIRVSEMVPDKLFDEADEVILVDLPPEDLLQRMKEGKVYLAPQAEKAKANFFRKGNLIALRELALRRTADRVDEQMRAYRSGNAIQQIWQANERILVGINAHERSSTLIHAAARFANAVKAEWTAVYVETPRLQKLAAEEREVITQQFNLVQSLGGSTVTLHGHDVGEVLLEYAQSRNISRIVVGKPSQSRIIRFFWPSVSERLIQNDVNIDIHVIPRVASPSPRRQKASIRIAGEQHFSKLKRKGYLWAIVVSGITSLAASVVFNYFELSNIIMLYLLGVMLIANKYGRGPGIAASLLSVVSFDFFFIQPEWSFSVSDTQFLFTFVIMLSVALVISNLTANLKRQAIIANLRERRSQALYEMGKELASAMTITHIAEVSIHHLSGLFGAKIAILVADLDDKLHGSDAIEYQVQGRQMDGQLKHVDVAIAQWTYDHQEQAGLGTQTLPSSKVLYVPLKAPMRTRGVLAIAPTTPEAMFDTEQRQLLDTFAAQIGLALERKHYVEVARDALISMESERLRNSLLSAISHDLRTPISVQISIIERLKQQVLAPEAHVLIDDLSSQTFHMNQLVINLLDMARLQAGNVTLNRQWQLLEEVVGSALRAMKPATQNHRIVTHIPHELPLIRYDAVLLERVICNLIDNAIKYSPKDTIIDISAVLHGEEIQVSIIDQGKGIPQEKQHSLFEKFNRGDKESDKPGVGLGLSICKTIIQAHHGKIWIAQPESGAGTVVTFSLPLEVPPSLREIEA
ncbi:sensor histidine kinase KdpD [Methylobacillus sp.]|uniref:sensor histidine kinase KdpD n=1 Tax=Methylobacillus sp. TaxID=56818 RepID=UPI002FE38E9E